MKNKNLKKCDHVAFLTNNYRRLEAFYISKLGFMKEKEEILPKSNARTIFGLPYDCIFVRLYTGDIKIEIFQPISVRLQKPPGRPGGLHHWGYCVDDRERFVQSLRKKKVKIIEVKRNAHVVYFVKDPDGNLAEIRDY